MFDVGYQNQIFNFHYPSIFKSKSSLPVKLRKGAKWYVSTLPEWTWRIRRKRYKIWEVWYKIPLFKIQRNIDTNWINIKKLNSTWMNQHCTIPSSSSQSGRRGQFQNLSQELRKALMKDLPLLLMYGAGDVYPFSSPITVFERSGTNQLMTSVAR